MAEPARIIAVKRAVLVDVRRIVSADESEPLHPLEVLVERPDQAADLGGQGRNEEIGHGKALAGIRGQVKQAGITRTALILVGRALGAAGFNDSRLYAAEHHHVLRPRMAASD